MKKILLLVIAVVIAGVAFYGGMKYGQSKSIGGLGQRNFTNLSDEERQQRMQQMGAANIGAGRGAGSNFSSGEIISKDDTSITIKLRDGGSKIIFYSETTEVGKFVNGSPNDLKVGNTVSVNGKSNDDGSITAQSVQIRPEMETPPQ